MARARNLKPGFFRNADLAEFGPWHRLLFAGLWTLADREGRLDDKPKQIKIDTFPCDDVDIDSLLQDIADRAPHMLMRYEVGGKRYLQVVNFRKHQNPHRDEKPSVIPDALGNLAESKKHGAGTMPAPDQPQAQTEAPGLHGANTVPIGLTPDSCILNPESLNLNPSTHKPDPPPEKKGGLSTEPVDKSICRVLEGHGIRDGEGHAVEILRLVDHGASVAMFEAAAKTAVTKKRPNTAYVLGIVSNRLQDAKSRGQGAANGPPGPQSPPLAGVGPPLVPALSGAASRPVPPAPPAVPPPAGFFANARRAFGMGGAGGEAAHGAA